MTKLLSMQFLSNRLAQKEPVRSIGGMPSNASPDGSAAKPNVSHPWWVVFIAVSSLLFMFLYLFLPPYVPRVLCPPDTFMSRHMGSEVGILGFFLGAPSCLVLILCAAAKFGAGARNKNTNASATRISFFKSIEKHPVNFATAAFCGLLISLIIWAIYAGSYYCATPDTIILHPDVLERSQPFTWSDVKVVRAYCFAGRSSPWQGGLILSLVDGEEILLELGTNNNSIRQNYAAIKLSLAGKVYQYDASDIYRCPRDVYPLFLNWRN